MSIDQLSVRVIVVCQFYILDNQLDLILSTTHVRVEAVSLTLEGSNCLGKILFVIIFNHDSRILSTTDSLAFPSRNV